jgi:hypothetical protein
MSEGYDGLPAYYIQSSDPLTPNVGFSLKGMDPIIAENFVLADTAIGVTSIKVNNVTVTNPNFNNTTPAAPGGSSNVTWQKDGSGNVSAYLTTPTSSWSSLTAAGGNLQINNAGFTTEFDQTSNVAWLWNNTTVATALTTNASPLLELAANYWTGAASAQDLWTIGSSLAAGTNGASTLTIAHSGSTGYAIVDIPSAIHSSSVLGNTLSAGVNNNNPQPGQQCVMQVTGSSQTVRFNLNAVVGWSSNVSAIFGGSDVGFYRLGAASLALGNGTASDTTGNLSLNQIIKYNGEATVAPGIAYLRGVTKQKSETGADASLLSVTPASAAGVYRISVVLSVSAANTATLGWTATWTDGNGHAQTPTNLTLQTAGSATDALTVSAAANGTYYGEWIVDVNNAGTAIVIKTTFSGTSIAYLASATIERVA